MVGIIIADHMHTFPADNNLTSNNSQWPIHFLIGLPWETESIIT